MVASLFASQQPGQRPSPPAPMWDPFTLTAGVGTDLVGYTSAAISPPAGSITNQPTPDHILDGFFYDTVRQIILFIMTGDVVNELNTKIIYVNGIPLVPTSVTIEGPYTVGEYPADLTLVDGEVYSVQFYQKDLWKPADLGPKLVVFMDAENAASLSITGGLVNSWSNSAGPGLAQVTATGNKPTLDPTAFPNSPGVLFDGVDDYLTSASTFTSLDTMGNIREFWALVRQETLGSVSGSTYVVRSGSTATSRTALGRSPVSGVNRARVTAGDGTIEVTRTGTLVDFSGVHVIRGLSDSTAIHLEIDDVSEGQAAVAVAYGASQFTLGASSPTTGFFKGPASAVLITYPLAKGEEALMYYFLNRRGGLA